MELPFAVESPERTSQLLPGSSTGGDDGSSLVTTSSQGSFLGSSSGTGGFATSANANTNNSHVPVALNPHQPLTPTHTMNAAISRPPVTRPIPPMVAPLPPSAPRPSSSSSGGGVISSGLNIFGALRVPSVLQSSSKPKAPPQQPTETIDFTYVNVCETDADEVDITLDGQHTAMEGLQGTLGEENESSEHRRTGDILTLLLSGEAQQESSSNEELVRQCEEANVAASQAIEAKRDGELQLALQAHSQAARQFRDAALLIKDRNEPMANSLLLLSQTQAKSALALKRIVKQQPIPNDTNASDAKNPRSKIITQKDRLRAAVRGALVTRNEAEMSDSAFLGRATKGPMTSPAIDTNVPISQSNTTVTTPSNAQHNPVDDMMELERELRDMDMALELGNSIASLDARTQSRLKSSFGADGSFMVVPPGSQSYMSSSNMWSPSPSSAPSHSTTTNQRSNNKPNPVRSAAAPPGTAGVRARANRVQNLVGTSTNHPRSPTHGLQQQPQQHAPRNLTTPALGLESSWWGNSITTSQVLASSVISLGASSMRGGVVSEGGGQTDPNASSANTKQLMRLMDALKTLGDENANLLREVEEAEAARMEAKAAKDQMAKFKSEYGKRFENLKAALEKFRKGYPENAQVGESSTDPNPVITSEFMRSASTTEQLQRQDQLIRKLTADLKKEKEESKKKDQALRKYESFYREVKARSAQKAAQRQREAAGQRPPQPQGGSRRGGHR